MIAHSLLCLALNNRGQSPLVFTTFINIYTLAYIFYYCNLKVKELIIYRLICGKITYSCKKSAQKAKLIIICIQVNNYRKLMHSLIVDKQIYSLLNAPTSSICSQFRVRCPVQVQAVIRENRVESVGPVLRYSLNNFARP